MSWLVAVDGTDPSLKAAEVVRQLLGKTERVHLVTACEPVETAIVGGHPLTTRMERVETAKRLRQIELENAQQILRDTKALFGQDQQVTESLVFDDPRKCLLDTAKQMEVSTLVLGTRDNSALQRVMLGSVSTHLARYAEIDVLVVKKKLPDAPRTMLCCWDGSARARHALDRMVAMARSEDQLFCLYVFKPRELSLVDRIRTGCDPNLSEFVEEINADVFTQKKKELKEHLQSSVRFERVEPIFREGQPVDIILQEATRLGTSLLALGSHNSTLLERLFIGTVAEQVLHQATAHTIFVAKTT